MQGARMPSVFLLVSGALEARAMAAAEPVRVIRQGGVAAEEGIGSRASAELAPGDAIVIPENGSVKLNNVSAEPAVLLFILQPSYVVIPFSNAINQEPLGGSARKLEAPLAVSLQQATVDPGATLPGAEAPETEQFAVSVDPDRMMDARSGANGSLHNAGDEPLEVHVLTVTSGVPAS